MVFLNQRDINLPGDMIDFHEIFSGDQADGA